MTPKIKIALRAPIFARSNRRARVLAKKSAKPGNEDRYPLQWRHDYVLKKAKKFIKAFNIDLEVEGYDDLPKGVVLFAPNHASSLDPAIMVAALENPSFEADQLNTNAVFIAKKELADKKKLIGYFKLKDTFFIDRENPRKALEVLDEALSFSKANKSSIIIFPEGTRSKDGKLNEFKAGAFRIAKKGFIPVVPVTISNTLVASDISRTDRLKVKVTFHKAIKPMDIISSGTKNVAERVQKIVGSCLEQVKGKVNKDFEKKI